MRRLLVGDLLPFTFYAAGSLAFLAGTLTVIVRALHS